MMIAKIALFIFCCALTSTWANAKARNWAVLVAGSNGWYNYRHQADVAHAYQILRANGIPKENIITMMYDDIAYNPQNPFPGQLFNDYRHQDVYNNTIINYRGSYVTPEMFLGVLSGSEDMKKAGFKVIESGPEDRVFIFFSDHGAPNLIAFPTGVLYAQQLTNTLKRMKLQGLFKQAVVYIEACYSGSMFDDLLSNEIDVYATTASSPDESSWAAFCNDEILETCLADEYSYSWMNDTVSHILKKWTLQEQYESVKVGVVDSHVSQYGEEEMSQLPVGDFLSYGNQLSRLKGGAFQFMTPVDKKPSSQAHLVGIMHTLTRANDQKARVAAQKKLHRALQLGRLVVDTFDDIVSTVTDRFVPSHHSQTTPEQLDCYKTIFDAFQVKCFTIQQVPEVAGQLIKFQKLCRAGYEAKQIVNVIFDICG